MPDQQGQLYPCEQAENGAAYLDDRWQNTLCIVCAQSAVELRQLCRHWSREHTQAYVHLYHSKRVSNSIASGS